VKEARCASSLRETSPWSAVARNGIPAILRSSTSFSLVRSRFFSVPALRALLVGSLTYRRELAKMSVNDYSARAEFDDETV
jgi:hypothetical protein